MARLERALEVAGLAPRHAAEVPRLVELGALAARVELRTFPRLRFHWDVTPENADHIEKILAELRKKK